jgi:hypothetical protein
MEAQAEKRQLHRYLYAIFGQYPRLANTSTTFLASLCLQILHVYVSYSF